MPDWRSELEILLTQLKVTLDHSQDLNNLQDDERPGSSGLARQASADKRPISSEAESDIPWELGPLIAEEPVDDGDEVSAVRSEIEATVTRVISLTEKGCLESALRDDVIFILQALTRPVPHRVLSKATGKQQEDARQEYQLTSAAAALRFCRIVLTLTQSLSSEAGC
ncbi:MAG: hypothetical protein ACLQUY_03960 [Ktedonobacterales bacterium]